MIKQRFIRTSIEMDDLLVEIKKYFNYYLGITKIPNTSIESTRDWLKILNHIDVDKEKINEAIGILLGNHYDELPFYIVVVKDKESSLTYSRFKIFRKGD